MRKNPVALVWLFGACAAIAVYLLGSNWLMDTLTSLAATLAILLDGVVRQLTSLTAGLVRALAIGLLVTFIGLSMLAIRAGQRGRMALILVSGGFLWLVGFFGGGASREDWVEALLLAAAGALVMTQRLLRRG